MIRSMSVVVLLLAFGAARTFADTIITGTTPELTEVVSPPANNTIASPFLNTFFLALTGDPNPSNFTGPALVPLVVDYAIDLTTGQGSVTDRTADGSALMTIAGQAGAFSVLSVGGAFEVAAFDSSLLSIIRVESPIGVPVPPSDPINGASVDESILDFAVNPSANPTAVAQGYWIKVEIPGDGSAAFHTTPPPPPVPEPSSLVLSGLGGLGLRGYTWYRRRRATASRPIPPPSRPRSDRAPPSRSL